MMDARTLARVLGGDVVGRSTVLAPGPGHSRRDRSLSIKLDPNAPEGFLAYSHCGDDWRECRDHVRERLGLPAWQPGQDRVLAYVVQLDHTTIDAESERRERSADDLRRMQRADAIWHQSITPHNTLAERYLTSRAIALTHDVAGTAIRFHPACPWRDENTGHTVQVPALIAVFRAIDNDTVTAIQRVALNADATKIGRRMLGVVHRSAVKLDPLGDTLAIGEGVETCLAARQLGHSPAWALGSVGMIAKFPVLDGVTRLRVLGETDAASADAFAIVAQRWHAAGRRVEIIMPDEGFSDLNDELMARAKVTT